MTESLENKMEKWASKMATKGCKKEMWENKKEKLDCRMETLASTTARSVSTMEKSVSNWDLLASIQLTVNWGNTQEKSENTRDSPVTWTASLA